ncbi:OLC1v1015604C1 [Oldenlandia corymbosa var. corymbosa]|uniref:OLC1v1015604C1 n=1 Tax=Oldenlandia corymbosa var. corymbosa TaxID=529605 RepID=A0AAV1E5Z2_OLDCO|nr:OLC1v1015604C1 [Oldenlandia corymbosa var. corymbosa]
MADKINFLKLEKERASKRKLEKKVRYIPEECVSNILVRLPLQSLPKAMLVCKTWNETINADIFTREYLERTETGLICLVRRNPPSSEHKLQEKTNFFSVESELLRLQSMPVLHQPFVDPTSFPQLQFLEVRDFKVKTKEYNATCEGKIRACCAGLIIVDNKRKRGGLVALNPVTRKLLALPVGTITNNDRESYGLARCPSSNHFKLVHLFRNDLQRSECEILTVGEESWRTVDGPSFGLYAWYGYHPVFAIGAINWIPFRACGEYIISMTLDDEKFQKISLPKTTTSQDRIVEIRGQLGFVGREEGSCRFGVWCLKSLSGKSWAKQYTIPVKGIDDPIPLYFTRIGGEMMIFKHRDGGLYAYNFSSDSKVMQKLEMQSKFFSECLCYFPHVNCLLSWK